MIISIHRPKDCTLDSLGVVNSAVWPREVGVGGFMTVMDGSLTGRDGMFPFLLQDRC